jgi:magnesium chelatase subunit I
VELVYEGELEGPAIVARNLIGKAIRTLFVNWFPEPEKSRKAKGPWPYEAVAAYFGPGKTVQLLNTDTNAGYGSKLDAIPGLDDLIFDSSCPAEPAWRHYWKEFILFGLAEYSVISKTVLGTETRFEDLLGSMMDLDRLGEEDEEGEDLA